MKRKMREWQRHNLMSIRTSSTCPWLRLVQGRMASSFPNCANDGWVTLDPGFLTTAQCESKITYIDGKHSILRYCGYPIEQLCENSDFLEVAWLLRHGELPSRAEYEQFCADINHKTMVGEDFRTFMGSFPRSAHPMSVLASAINALATFYPDTTDISDNDQLDEAAKIIMAKARTIVSYIFRRRRDEPMLIPRLRARLCGRLPALSSLCRTSRLNPEPAVMCRLWVVC